MGFEEGFAIAQDQLEAILVTLPSNPSDNSLNAAKITVTTRVNAPLDQVWHAYTNPEDIKQWNTASDDWHTTSATVDLREGGEFCSRMEAKDGSMGFDFAGRYTKIVENELIEYEFGDRCAQVEFKLLPCEVNANEVNANAVNVSVTFESEADNTVEQQRTGWQAILDNFARHVEATA
ncbi:MAG: hypothetical protein HC800_12820 [Phormidesmis sp. RL_2_1]|nr:hypothetical protein [Phormidesmis sp. RL_2_1]